MWSPTSGIVNTDRIFALNFSMLYRYIFLPHMQFPPADNYVFIGIYGCIVDKIFELYC
jgi:hypothetical protein